VAEKALDIIVTTGAPRYRLNPSFERLAILVGSQQPEPLKVTRVKNRFEKKTSPARFFPWWENRDGKRMKKKTRSRGSGWNVGSGTGEPADDEEKAFPPLSGLDSLFPR
jgi:hypothetical protein